MSEVVSPSEYRKKRQKVVQTSSGYKWLIRKMPPSVGNQLLHIFGVTEISPEMKEEDIKVDPEKLLEAIEVVLPTCVVKPKIVAGEGSEDALSLDEIDFGDQIELTFEIIDFSGLSAAAQKARELFRKTSTR